MRSLGLVGRRRTGKDTVAAHLAAAHSYQRVAFADALKAAAMAVDPMISTEGVRLASAVELYGWEHVKDTYPEARRVLQHMGAGIREAVGDHVWRDRAGKAIDAAKRRKVPVVVSDVRYPDEAEMLRKKGFTIVRLVRPLDRRTALDEHESETLADTMRVDVEVSNTGSISELVDRIEQVISATR